MKTALYQKHIDLGAKMVPFAGFQMPVQYQGVSIEHHTVREKAGLFDVSHMGQFFFEGENAKALLQKITTNNVDDLFVGRAQYSCMTNSKGGIVDDLVLYMLEENKYLMVVNASNISKDWNWVQSNNNLGVKVSNLSDEYSLLAIQGPLANQAISTLTEVKVDEIKFYHFAVGTFAGVEDVIISGTGYTGSGGVEIYFKNQDAEHIWDSVLKAGEPFGMIPCGLAARDTLRLEKGYCLYGNDINDTTTPLEAGLGWITKFSKDFNAKDILEAQKSTGVTRKLVGFTMIEKGIPRHDYPIVNANGEEIGIVTSGTMSPTAKLGIGLGYVPTEFSTPGSEIYIQIRDKNIKAEVSKIPFV
ncbi:MAG: glycine cleavage system protein T [Flavobacteriaceae bacterium]|nr:MAG: glycine cleavage system protein T [Flavobacteriaceae bacterium]